MKLLVETEIASMEDEKAVMDFVEQELGFVKSKVRVQYAHYFNTNIRNIAFTVMGQAYTAHYDPSQRKWIVNVKGCDD